MKRQLIAILLILHGLIHLMFEFIIYDSSTGDYVGWSGQSWLLTNPLGTLAVLIIGRIIWGLTIAGFVAAGIILFSQKKSWRILAIVASAISLLGYFLLWDGLAPEPYYWVVGPVIGGVVIVSLLLFRWPKDDNLFSKKRSTTE